MAGRDVEWRDRAKSVAAVVLPAIVVAVSLGVLSGWLTGLSGPDNTVTASAIPALLSLIGAFAFAKSAGDGHVRLQLTLFVAVFCLAFYFALRHGTDPKEAFVRDARAGHLQHLQGCSRLQLFVNDVRMADGQGPLGPEYFCRKVPNGAGVLITNPAGRTP
ncbi:MAG: hypothetical protein OXH99_16490 [Bryobacterales bacterium]|nr:hypothetical protein [Bryobacterales bacterium]